MPDNNNDQTNQTGQNQPTDQQNNSNMSENNNQDNQNSTQNQSVDPTAGQNQTPTDGNNPQSSGNGETPSTDPTNSTTQPATPSDQSGNQGAQPANPNDPNADQGPAHDTVKKGDDQAAEKPFDSGGLPVVEDTDIEKVVSRWTGIPITKLTEKESEKLLHMEDIIHKNFINHERAVKAVAEAIRRGRIGLASASRPIASFIFLGPTGTGKTELAKVLAEIMFGKKDAMIRLDMSEYMEKHEVAKLVGAPPGYVGYEEGGQLTEAVRSKPYSIVLLDEIEKAHPDVFNILLQLLEDGRLTDNKGNTISFKNTVIIATSNIGSQLIQQKLQELNVTTPTADIATAAAAPGQAPDPNNPAATPADPNKPTDPNAPVQPGQTAPVNLSAQPAVAAPTDPNNPTAAQASGNPAVPANPAQPTTPADPNAPQTTAQTVSGVPVAPTAVPGQPVNPVTPPAPGTTPQPGATAVPGQTPTAPAGPANSIVTDGEDESADPETRKRNKVFKELSGIVMDELTKHFRPELINRFDEVVIFEPLSQENMMQIAKLGVEATRKMLKEQGIDLQITEAALRQLAKEGYDPAYGARPLRRLIQRSIENPIAIYMIERSAAKGDVIIISYDSDKDEFTFTKKGTQNTATAPGSTPSDLTQPFDPNNPTGVSTSSEVGNTVEPSQAAGGTTSANASEPSNPLVNPGTPTAEGTIAPASDTSGIPTDAAPPEVPPADNPQPPTPPPPQGGGTGQAKNLPDWLDEVTENAQGSGEAPEEMVGAGTGGDNSQSASAGSTT